MRISTCHWRDECLKWICAISYAKKWEYQLFRISREEFENHHGYLNSDIESYNADSNVIPTIDEKTFNREIFAWDRIKNNYPKFVLILDFDDTELVEFKN